MTGPMSTAPFSADALLHQRSQAHPDRLQTQDRRQPVTDPYVPRAGGSDRESGHGARSQPCSETRGNGIPGR